MPETTKPGIDYGLGQSNIDAKTGIRCGVISSNEVCQAWADSSEANYGDATCPKCGNPAETYVGQDNNENGEEWESTPHECADYACAACRYIFGSESAFGEDPISWYFDDDEYLAEQFGDDSDIFITKSPYYTRAQFCSPCAPGAGYLMNPCDSGPKTYCFSHDWFEDEKAPYPVYRVSDDTEVLPD